MAVKAIWIPVRAWSFPITLSWPDVDRFILPPSFDHRSERIVSLRIKCDTARIAPKLEAAKAQNENRSSPTIENKRAKENVAVDSNKGLEMIGETRLWTPQSILTRRNEH